MKPDIPIIGQPEKKKELFCMDLWYAELRRMDEAANALASRLKIRELRKSCGVDDNVAYTIKVNVPPRYIKQ